MHGLSYIGRDLEIHLVLVVYVPYWLKIFRTYIMGVFSLHHALLKSI